MSKRRKQLYNEMDDFIGFLRKKEDSSSRFSIFDKLKRKRKIERKPEFSEITEMPEVSEETKIQEAPEIETVPEEKEEKKTFMSVMGNMFKKKEKVEDLPEEAVKLELYKTEMEGDAKKALEIADSLIKKIPNFELRKFMQSEDYEKYESVMKKYGLR